MTNTKKKKYLKTDVIPMLGPRISVYNTICNPSSKSKAKS